jgi:NADPH:quinone reductase-like Zn-dependent oxidoreductase
LRSTIPDGLIFAESPFPLPIDNEKGTLMRALMYERYGDESVLQLREVPAPVPGAGQVQVKVKLASLNPVDYKLRNGMMKLLRKPSLPAGIGKDFAGVVTAIGTGVKGFAVGQRVFGSADALSGDGSCADSLVIATDRIALTPDAVSDCLGVAAGSALQALTTIAKLQKGQRLLVVGASGSVGAAGVQIGHSLGAHVTGVCGTSNVDYVKGIGADRVIDYKTTNWQDGSDSYDVILDAGGTHIAFNHARRRLAKTGFYIDTFPDGARFLNKLTTSLFSSQHCLPFMLKTDAALLQGLAAWAARGVLQPRVAQRIPLENVAQALRQMEDGKVQGKVVVILSPA